MYFRPNPAPQKSGDAYRAMKCQGALRKKDGGGERQGVGGGVGENFVFLR